MPLLPPDYAYATELDEQLRERLGDDTYAEANSAGGDLTREAAVALAALTLARARDVSAQAR
jgi:hypothetical protein